MLFRFLSLAAVLALCLGTLNAEDKTKAAGPDMAKMMAAMMKHATPGDHHKVFAPLVGKWSYTAEMWMDPSAPPMKMAGICERKMAMDGRFLMDHIKGTDAQMPFEGMGCWGYDNGKKKYWYVWVDSMSTGCTSAEGGYDPAAKTLTMSSEGYCPCEEKVVRGRDVTKFVSADEVVTTYYKMTDGKESKAMEITSKRVK